MEEKTIARQLNGMGSATLIEDIVHWIKEYSIDIDITDLSPQEAYNKIKDMSASRDGSYVIINNETLIYNHDTSKTLHVKDYLAVLGSPRYEQTISDSDVGRYVEILSLEKCKLICADLADYYSTQITRCRIAKVTNVRRPESRCNLIYNRVYLRNSEDREIQIPSCFISKLLSPEEIVRVEAEIYYDSCRQEETEILNRRKRELILQMTEVEKQLYCKVDRESAIQDIIKKSQIDESEIIKNYPIIHSIVANPDTIIVVFKEGLPMRFNKSGFYVDFESKEQIGFKISRSSREIKSVGPLKHPHISGWGEFCKGGFAYDFAKAAAIRDIYYVIELLLVFISSAGFDTCYYYPDETTFCSSWGIKDSDILYEGLWESFNHSKSGDNTSQFIEFCKENQDKLKSDEDGDD